MEYTSKILIWLSAIILFCSLTACESGNQKLSERYEILTVKQEPQSINLFYQSIIKPISAEPVVSPVDGNVAVMNFYYGQIAKKGDKLFVIFSETLQTNYRTALTTYLKNKETYLNAVANFQGTQQLKNYGLIQEQTYISDKSTVESDSLTLLTSRYELEKTLKYIPDVSFDEIDKLTLGDVRKVEKILSQDYNRVTVDSPATGIILLPDKSASGTSQLVVGSQVKKDQTLVTIGDLSGLEMSIKVGQRDINRIKEGMKVVVSTPAIPNITLEGNVVAVGAQAEDTSGQSEFPVTVTVEKLTAEDKKLLKVGMTAKVEITIELPPILQIPLNAVTIDEGQPKVELIDPKTGKSEFIPVTTGRTSLNQVAIESGLKPGDKIIVRD